MAGELSKELVSIIASPHTTITKNDRVKVLSILTLFLEFTLSSKNQNEAMREVNAEIAHLAQQLRKE
jgi:hypothetical protein